MKVLIVEDEAPLRRVCERTLQAEGYSVSTASSGTEVLQVLREDWDIVLTDITLPGGANGFDVLNHAKRSGSADVIMMTAFPNMELTVRALRLGAHDFIVKPFGMEVLKAAVRRCAHKRELSRELAREKALRAELERTHSELALMQKAKDMFGHFVTPEVVDYVLALPREAWKKGTLKTLTVLFADVRGFTPFASRVTPDKAVETLNEVLAFFVAAVQREGGIVNKFMGDGVLALFGAPVERNDHARAAALAAWGANKAIAAIGSGGSGLPPLRMGFGINTGEAVAGFLGTPERAEYSVIGHTVNLAARLEKAAAPGQILLGPETVRLLGEDFRVQAKGQLHLAGIPEPVSAMELLGRATTPPAARSFRAIFPLG